MLKDLKTKNNKNKSTKTAEHQRPTLAKKTNSEEKKKEERAVSCPFQISGEKIKALRNTNVVGAIQISGGTWFQKADAATEKVYFNARER